MFSVFGLSGQVYLQSYKSDQLDYANPQEYEIGGITISGVNFLDENILIQLTGLKIGDRIEIPGEKITKAIQNLWKQQLFSDIKIELSRIESDLIFLNINLQEQPRLSKFSFSGVKKSEADEIREKIKLTKGKVVTEHLVKTTTNKVRDYYVEKGFLNVEINISQKKDTSLPNSIHLQIDVNKKKRVKINDITFTGNYNFSDNKLKRALKETKKKRWYNLFATSRYLETAYEEDKLKIIEKYNAKGFRDAAITTDTVYRFDIKTVNIHITINEGKKYYFRNITWAGNSKYTDKELYSVLGIKKGDLYSQKELETRLFMNPNSRDVSSLYLDDGYLFFQVTPVEVLVDNDSIDMEIRIYEGPQATINKITITGNTKTNDHVILREIRTLPGQKFSRSDIIRSQRELAQLGYFDPEKLGVNPVPHPESGNVDIEYVVEEKPSDQIELSGGWGGGRLGIVGTLGVSFNNFSARNMFKKGAWQPLPSGDGQRLSVRAQSTGVAFQSYNLSFTEPWFGGKKPNSLSYSIYHTIQTNGEKRTSDSRRSLTITGTSIGLGKRLKFPDDYFTVHHSVSYQYYTLKNWFQSAFIFTDGHSNNLNYRLALSRNSVDQPIYPRSGSMFTFSVQATPPFSFFNKLNYDDPTLSNEIKYKWIEYHKWKFDVSWFTRILGNLVLNSKAQYGFLGLYNYKLGHSPFERFQLGGDGLSGFSLFGTEVVKLRGYDPYDRTKPDSKSLTPFGGSTIYNKYTFELRYPLSLNPSATIYVLGFLEGGNTWMKFNQFNPFEVKRSAGLGIRLFLPMFGVLGVDWGYGFDRTAPSSTFQIILGFEPY